MNRIATQSWMGSYRGFIQGKTRITLAWIFAILLGLSAQDYPQWPGISLCFIGASLRYWASGYLRKDRLPAVGGPYGLVRNPLYLGTYLMALGTAMAVENWWLLATCSILFAAIYHYIILDEETKLIGLFGEPYRVYLKSVPRFFPRLWRPSAEALDPVNPDRSQRVFSSELAWKNKAYEAYAAFAAMIGFVSLIAFIWRNLIQAG